MRFNVRLLLYAWKGKGKMNGPAISKSGIKRLMGDARSFSPFHDATSDSIVSDKAVDSAISLLLRTCRPAAVARLIVSAVVNAVDAVRWRRTRSHVRVKVGKRLQPAFTNLDPATAIAGIAVVCFYVASLFHASPRIVLMGYSPFGSKSVLATSFRNQLGTQATTTFAAPGFQGVALDWPTRSANTTAIPVGRTYASAIERQYRPSSKYAPGKIFATELNRIVCSHDGNLLQRFRFWLEPNVAMTCPGRLALL